MTMLQNIGKTKKKKFKKSRTLKRAITKMLRKRNCLEIIFNKNRLN